MVAGEDARWHGLSAGCRLRKRVGHLVEAPWDVIEFEAIEFILQSSNFLAICSHLGVMTAQLLHDLVDDQLRVTPDVKASDAQLDGDA